MLPNDLPDKFRPLKILMLLSNAFDPDPRVHREALALIEAGHQVTILCWDRDRKAKAAEIVDGIYLKRIYVSSTHGRGSAQMFYLVAFWVKAFLSGRKMDFDIVHSHDFDTLPLGYALARLRGAQLVYDSHESYIDMVHHLPTAIRKLIVFTENWLLKRTDLVITVGNILMEFLQNRGATKVCVVGNWQNPSHFQFDETELQDGMKNLGIEEGQKVIAFIANLGIERKIPELIEAVSKTPDTFLILGGNGPCAGLALEAADKFSNIHYLNYVDPQNVPYYTAIADIIFYGFDPENPNARFSAPNKLFECLAAGKVMLTGDFGEIGRIVREMECGIILPDYSVSAIQTAINDLTVEQLQIYSNNALVAGQEHYCWSAAAKALIDNYPRKCHVG